MKVLLAVLLLALSLHAEPGAEFHKFDKWYGTFTVNDCDSKSFDALFDNQKVDIYLTEGLVINLNCAGADSELTKIFTRLTPWPLQTEELRMQPRGDWQYAKPMVFMVNEQIAESYPVKMFLLNRPNVEVEKSGSMDEAKSHLKKFLRRLDQVRYDRMNRMFEENPDALKESPIAPEQTPTPR